MCALGRFLEYYPGFFGWKLSFLKCFFLMKSLDPFQNRRGKKLDNFFFPRAYTKRLILGVESEVLSGNKGIFIFSYNLIFFVIFRLS